MARVVWTWGTPMTSWMIFPAQRPGQGYGHHGCHSSLWKPGSQGGWHRWWISRDSRHFMKSHNPCHDTHTHICIYIYNYLFLYIYNVILYRTCSYYPFVMHNSHTSSGPMLRGSTRFCGLGCLQFGDGRSRKHDKNDSVVVVVVVVVVVLVLVVVVVVVFFSPMFSHLTLM